MKISFKITLLFVAAVLFFQIKCHAQQVQMTMPAPTQPATKDKLAMQYFEQKEFEKANVYFDDLFDANPSAWYYYYYKSLLGAKEYSKAEKITKKQLKQNKQNVFLYVYLGRIYKLEEDSKKEKESYEKALKELEPIQPNIENLANAFKEDNLYDYAIDVYNKARKVSPDYPYYYERAEVYKAKNDLSSMINEYLDALEFRDSEIQTVQTNLQNSLGYDDEAGGIRNPLLKQELQKRIQKHPDKIILSEFLIFIQKQQKDFDGAFVQSRALDKRLKEEGNRIYELAKICVSNQNWDVAKRCFDYLIEKGPENLYYDSAIIDGLNVEYLALTQKPQPSNQELILLEEKLTKANKKYKTSFLNPIILKNLASLKAYYLNKSEEAIELLESFINLQGLEATMKAEYKIMLADIYLLKGEIWEASLLYSQVEKDFKYEAIGQEAKFRNAKLSFYAGDFAWAKTQADVLKGATTKLIANDALDLSLIITDAIGVDTNDIPLKLFSSAELMILQHRYTDAIARMDSINLLFSTNTLGDDIYFKKAQIYFKLGKYLDVEAMYKNIVEYYPGDLYGDDAQFRLAELYDKNLNDKEKAKLAYEDVLVKYQGSIFTVEARRRFRELRGDNLSN
ncbi:tetratricopeptide repeat protein [Aurantibacillus circumpalustris]|uniref:tetratricopeptide repeat protein n=1 Tax=Aurantibacillus circumpalustris TaxID=3036359 RepID=UPI00295AB7D5|nr:tetratricopeptide repeat protein [Aurantibacillus circumpalustris]